MAPQLQVERITQTMRNSFQYKTSWNGLLDDDSELLSTYYIFAVTNIFLASHEYYTFALKP